MHSINTRNTSNFYQPPWILTSFQKGPYCLGIKVFSCLPELIKNLSHNMKQFKSPLEVFIFPQTLFRILCLLTFDVSLFVMTQLQNCLFSLRSYVCLLFS